MFRSWWDHQTTKVPRKRYTRRLSEPFGSRPQKRALFPSDNRQTPWRRRCRLRMDALLSWRCRLPKRAIRIIPKPVPARSAVTAEAANFQQPPARGDCSASGAPCRRRRTSFPSGTGRQPTGLGGLAAWPQNPQPSRPKTRRPRIDWLHRPRRRWAGGRRQGTTVAANFRAGSRIATVAASNGASTVG